MRKEYSVEYKIGVQIGEETAALVCSTLLAEDPDRISEFLDAEDKDKYCDQIIAQYDLEINTREITLECLNEQKKILYKVNELVSTICSNINNTLNKVRMTNITLEDLMDIPRLSLPLAPEFKTTEEVEELLTETKGCLRELYKAYDTYFDAVKENNEKKSLNASEKIDEEFEYLIILKERLMKWGIKQ